MTPTRWGFVKVPSPLEMKYGLLLGRGAPMSKVVKHKTFYCAFRPWPEAFCSIIQIKNLPSVPNLKTNLSQCPTEPVDAEPGPPPPVCDGEKMIYFLKTSGAATILLAYILYKHPSIILSFKETNRPAPMASVALKSDKNATSFPIVATRPTRRVVQQTFSLTSAPRCFGFLQTHLSLSLSLSFCLYLSLSCPTDFFFDHPGASDASSCHSIIASTYHSLNC